MTIYLHKSIYLTRNIMTYVQIKIPSFGGDQFFKWRKSGRLLFRGLDILVFEESGKIEVDWYWTFVWSYLGIWILVFLGIGLGLFFRILVWLMFYYQSTSDTNIHRSGKLNNSNRWFSGLFVFWTLSNHPRIIQILVSDPVSSKIQKIDSPECL